MGTPTFGEECPQQAAQDIDEEGQGRWERFGRRPPQKSGTKRDVENARKKLCRRDGYYPKKNLRRSDVAGSCSSLENVLNQINSEIERRHIPKCISWISTRAGTRESDEMV
jgi:hypothetical protein